MTDWFRTPDRPSPLRRPDMGGPLHAADRLKYDYAGTPTGLRSFASTLSADAVGEARALEAKALVSGDERALQTARMELANRERLLGATPTSGSTSFSDAQAAGDYGSYIANTLGSAAGSMAKPLLGAVVGGAGASALRNAVGGVAGGFAGSYDAIRNAEMNQIAGDPQLATLSPEHQLELASSNALKQAGLESALPAYMVAGGRLPGALNRIPRPVRIAGGVAGEAGTEAAQSYISQSGAANYFPDREIDYDELRENAIAGAIGGGAFSAVSGHGEEGPIGHEAAPVQEPPIDLNPPSAPMDAAPPDDGSGGGAGGLFDTLNERFGPGLREQAQKTKDYVSDTIDRMGEAAKTAQSPSDFLRQVFSNSSEEAAADLRPDTEDPGVMGAADPAAALQQRDAQRQERAASFATELLNDPATPDTIKERVSSFGGDFTNPEAQAFVARNLVSQRAGEKLVHAVNELIDLSKDFGGKAADLAAKARGMIDKGMTAAADRIVKKNLQDATPAEQATFNKLVFDSLTDEAKASPAVRQRLPELANSMLAFAARTGDLTKADLKTLSRMQDGLAMFRDPEQLAAQLTEYAGLPRTEDSFLSRVKRVTNAQQDILQPNSFLYSSLTEEAKDSLRPAQLNQLARLVDDFTLSDQSKAQGDKVLAGLTAAFGSKDAARSVLDYYQQQNRADLRFDPNEMLTEGGTTERDGAPAPTYQFADAKAMRPYRAFAGQMSSEGGMRRRLRESTIAGAALRRSSPGGARVRPVKMSQYVTDTGGNPEAEVKRIASDLKDRIEQHKARKDEDRTKQINELQGELTLMRQAYKDGGAQAALDLYEVLQVSGQEQNDTIATDADIAKMATLADAKDAKETRVTFQREDGSKFTLSAESMWKTLGDKEGSGKGENAQARAKRLFADAAASVLARPEVAKMVTPMEKILIDRKLGVQAKKKGNPEYRAMVADALKAAEGSIKSLQTTLDNVVDEYLEAADNEAKSEEYGSRREEIEGIIEKNIDQLSERLDAAREGEGPMAGNMPAQAVARQKLRMYRDAQSQIDAVKFDEAFDERDNNRSGVPGAEDAPTDFGSEFRRMEREHADLQHAYDVAYDSGDQTAIANAKQALEAVKERIKGVEAREATERSYGSAGWMGRESRGMGPRYSEEDTGLGVGVEKRGQKAQPSAEKKEAKAEAKKKTPSRVILPQISRYAAKDQAKSDRANKFIGRGSPGSSTAAYAEAWGDRANVGEYSPEDTVFISVNGNRPGALSPPWPEIKKAMTGGATLITDVPADRARSFNTGERAVADFLDGNGYFEESPGTWVRGYDIDNATGQKRYAPLGKGASQQAPKDAPGRVAKNSFVGAKADPQGAADAEGLLNVGAPADVVWRELGWFRGPDGKLRKEIRSPVLRRRVRELATAIANGSRDTVMVRDLLAGVDAFKPYLDKLGDLPVDPNDGMVELMGAVGAYNGEDGFSNRGIGISRLNAELAVRMNAVPGGKGVELVRELVDSAIPPELKSVGLNFVDPTNLIAELEARHPMPDVNERVAELLTGTILHELQHAFQHAEGFENGGNATTAVIAKYGDVDEYIAAIRDGDDDTVASITEQAFAQLRAEVGPDGDLEAAAHELYESIVGEVEANDVAARMKLSDEEAASVKPALMDAKREFVRSVLLAEALSTVRAGLKKSAIGGRPGRPGKNWGDKDAVKAEILRLRGKDVKVAVGKLVKQLGGSGQYTYDPATGARLIEVAINARSPVGTARHEAMHDLFRFLSENDATRSVAKDLRDATSAPHVIRQLREWLKDHKAALEQLNDPEERAAYAYQFWAEGLLRIGPTGTGFFHTIRQFLKDLFGVVTAGQRGEDLMRAFHDGKFADPSVVQEVLQDINDSSGDRVSNKLNRAAPALARAVDSLLSAAPDRLRRFENDYLNVLADKFQPENGTGFVQNKFQQEGVWTNRLGGILRGTTAVERREAIDQLQAMKPTSKLAKDLAKFNEDIYEYMRDAGVQSWDSATKKFVPLRKVQGYFTRSWDPDAIARNRSEFEALLRTEGGVSAKSAAALVENLVRGSEQRPKPKESPVDLGFMPYAPHTSERVLTFIKPSNADKFAKFQRKDLADIMMSYVRGSTHRAEYAREFGNNGEKIVDLVTKSGVKDTKELGEISNAVQALEGSLDPGNWSVQTKEAMSAVLTLQNVTLLPLALFSQMVDPIVLAARTGDIKDAGTAYVTALKRLKNSIAGGKNKVPGEELAEILGVVSEDSTLQAMSMAYGTTRMSKRMENINRVFFKYNGMQGWNNSMRIAATAAGEKYLLAHKGDAKALAELGLEPKDVKVGKNGKLDVSSPKVQQAMFQFVDQAVLRPSAANRPVWMSDPRFLLVAHLKQFTYAMHNVVLKRASRELADDNPKPWGILMLAMPAILAADMAKFALTGTAPSTWGFKDYLVHAVERSGLLGLGDFGVQATRGVDMGKMPGEGLLGPSFENLMEILRWIGGDPRTGLGDVIDRTVPGSRFI